MNKLGKGPLADASCQISNVWAFRFQRRRCLNKLLTDAHTHGRRTNLYHKSSPWHFVPGELTNQNLITLTIVKQHKQFGACTFILLMQCEVNIFLALRYRYGTGITYGYAGTIYNCHIHYSIQRHNCHLVNVNSFFPLIVTICMLSNFWHFLFLLTL